MQCSVPHFEFTLDLESSQRSGSRISGALKIALTPGERSLVRIPFSLSWSKIISNVCNTICSDFIMTVQHYSFLHFLS